jgi:hypothetical protein
MLHKDLEMAQKAGKRLNEPYESAPTMKDIRLYMFKDKYAIFKMQAGKSVPEMSHQFVVDQIGEFLGERKENDVASARTSRR